MVGTFLFVELGGFEPPSKRGTNELSTCVFFGWFSCRGRPKTTNRDLILLNFDSGIEACPNLFPIVLHHRGGMSRKGDCRVMSRLRDCRED